MASSSSGTARPRPATRPVSRVSEAVRGDVVAAVILFSGCASDGVGRCNTLADFRVLRPDGSVYAEHADAIVWRQAPVDGSGLQLSQAHLAFEIEPEDPVGVYEIHATVRDLIAGKSVALVQTLAVAPATGQ